MNGVRFGAAALFVAAAAGLPGAARASHPARSLGFDLGSMNSYFSAVVTTGPTAGHKIEGLLSLTANAGTLTLGNGTAAPASSGMATSGMTLTATLPNGVIHGRVTSSQPNTVTGTFTGPAAGVKGYWIAQRAVHVLNYAVTGKVTSGPQKGTTVLIGDLLADVTSDGTVFGTYTDNSKAGPGIVAKVISVHGTYVDGIVSAGMAFNPMTAYALIGKAGKFFGLGRLEGTMIGPDPRSAGTWAGLDQGSS